MGWLGLLGHPNFAHGGFACCHVEHNGNWPGCGKRDRDWIVADHPLGAARRRHQRTRVAHGDPDASRLGSALRIPTRGPEVEAMAHRRNSHSERLRPLDRKRHGLLPGELAQCMAGIQHHR